jgi:hypothetical protein
MVICYLYDIWITAYMIKFVSDLQQVGGFLCVLSPLLKQDMQRYNLYSPLLKQDI